MAEQSTFARRMMAQKLMAEKRDDPFSDSRFFAGKMRPSMDDIENPTRLSDMAGPAYGAAATGSLFVPGSGIADVFGYAPDPMQSGKMLPSFGENIGQGKYLDAGLQTLGVAGDVLQAGGAFVPPLAVAGTMLKAPRAARVASSSLPSLSPAIRSEGKILKGGVGETHLDVLTGIQDKNLARRLISDGENRGFVTEKGKYLSRDRAVDYALQNDLIDQRFSSFYSPDRYGELVADHLRKPVPIDPNEAAGAAMNAAQARYFETGKFEPPTADNPVSIVPPTETEPGIIAFHGSGADFDEFRLEMIGTGEGAQAYGYGLYFTDSEDIARFYKDAVGGSGYKKLDYNADADASQSITDVNFKDVDGYRSYPIDKAQDLIKSALKTQRFNVEPDEKALNIFEMTFERDGALQIDMRDGTSVSFLKNLDGDELTVTPLKKAAGKMYKVGLAPKPDELLDYDLPLSQQPKILEKIKAGIASAIDENVAQFLKEINIDPAVSTGGDLEKALDGLALGPNAHGTKELASFGIPGIKYRAAGSRGANTKDDAAQMNYVIFDDKAVNIMEKYGIVGPVAVTSAGAAAVNRGRNDNDNGGSILPDAGVL